MNKIDKVEDLSKLMGKVIKAGQEGLVIKDKNSIYEPNARHWLKLKRDYIHGMADSADLYVLGAYFGTGNKGGLMTVKFFFWLNFLKMHSTIFFDELDFFNGLL